MPVFEWEVERTPLEEHDEPVGQLKRRIGPLEAVAAAQRGPQGLQRGSRCAKERLKQVRAHGHLDVRPPSHRRWALTRLVCHFRFLVFGLRLRLVGRWPVLVLRLRCCLRRCLHRRLNRVCTLHFGHLDALSLVVHGSAHGRRRRCGRRRRGRRRQGW